MFRTFIGDVRPERTAKILLSSVWIIAQFGLPGGLSAQESEADLATGQSAPEPLTLKQNYEYSIQEVFAPQRLAVVAIRATIDHMVSSGDGWGSGAPNYGIRTASWLGRNLVRENVAFGIRALDGEDPRYFRSGKGSFARRTGYAVSHTFMSRTNRGESVFAYSLLANYATPLIAEQWQFGTIRGGRELRAGTFAVGTTVATNLGREFWPDFKKKLHR